MTSAPASAIARAITRPSPRLPPVMNKRFPSSRNRSSTDMLRPSVQLLAEQVHFHAGEIEPTIGMPGGRNLESGFASTAKHEQCFGAGNFATGQAFERPIEHRPGLEPGRKQIGRIEKDDVERQEPVAPLGPKRTFRGI